MRALLMLLWPAVLAAQILDRDALLHIVQQRCVVGWLKGHVPDPCKRVVLSPGTHDGYAVLADRKGGVHFLLIPTRTLVGIEAPALMDSGTPNYFAAAWDERAIVASAAGRALTRDQFGFAVNTRHARGQDQLHIHMECVGSDLYQALHEHLRQLDTHWRPLAVAGHTYQALRLSGEHLSASPFRLLAEGLPAARAEMSAYTLVLTGVSYPEGAGFAVIAGHEGPSGEKLLDSTCAVALGLGAGL